MMNGRREHPDVHIAFMLTAFGLDLALLGWIEVTRHPMARAPSRQPSRLANASAYNVA